MRIQTYSCAGALALFLGLGCGAGVTSAELVSARRAYTDARNGSAAAENPAAVHDAYKALQAAERAHADDPGSNVERHRAYVATRKAELAMAGAGEALARKEQQRALSSYEQNLVQQSQRARAESAQYAQQLTQTAQQLQENSRELSQREAELQKRENELRETQLLAERAREELRQLEALREEEGRLVISLAGGVLFEAGGHELSPSAESRLDTVVRALAAYPDRPVLIEGHTDDRGSEEKNRQLSHDRAEAVRAYLERRGVPGERLRAVGRGESSPIASNSTPEGRANNRRVEIIVEGADRAAPGHSQANPATGSHAPASESPEPRAIPTSRENPASGTAQPGDGTPAAPREPR